MMPPATRTTAAARARRIRLRTAEAAAGGRVQCASGARRRRSATLLALASLSIGPQAHAAPSPVTADEPRSLPAAFAQRSYAPGDEARLVLWRRIPRITLRLYRVGPERGGTRANDVLPGVPEGPSRTVRANGALEVRVPPGPSGLYYARVSAAGGRFGYAPFVLRPRRLGTSRVAVVEPTNTWQAYN